MDSNVNYLYGGRIAEYFAAHNSELKTLVISTDETKKAFDTVFRIIDFMNEFKVARRDEPVIAIGGGVLLDIVGVAANLYRRGIPYIRIPTTLMGLIDAGIGVKTGVNYRGHKNRLGTYYAPICVMLDRYFINTLDERHVCNGISEIIKIALGRDRRLFELLERVGPALIADRFRGGPDQDEIMRRAIVGMLDELEPNLWEDRLERVVDYGHSFSPTLEMKALPELLHGEAVAVDMVISVSLSGLRGLMSEEEVFRALTLISCFRLPIFHSLIDTEFLWNALAETTIHRGGLQRLPLTRGIGSTVFVNDVERVEIDAALKQLKDAVDALGQRSRAVSQRDSGVRGR